MKQLILFLCTITILSGTGFFQSAVASGPNDDPDITLTVLGTTENSKSVKIDYSIPYPGYVEFSLFKGEDTSKKIWYKAQVRQKGEHSLNISRSALKAGVDYVFKFGYKGKMIQGNFNVG